MQNLPHLTTVKLKHCWFASLPSGIEYLKEVTELDLSECTNLESLPENIGNLTKLTTLNLSCPLGLKMSLRELPESIGNLSNLTSLNLSGCESFVSLPSSIGNLSQLNTLDLTYCSSLESLPESIGNLSNLTSLHLGGCNYLESLPESVGNLSKLTLLDLSECWNVDHIPSFTQQSTQLTHPLWLYGCIEIPLNIEWDNFSEGIGLIEYLRYMVKMKRCCPFVYGLSRYLGRFYEGKKRVEEIFEICGREEDGRVGMIQLLCEWLSGRMIENSEGSVYLDGKRLSGSEIRDYGVGCLSILFEQTCGMEMKPESSLQFVSTGRMKEVWMNRGNEEEGKEEWKRRWREIVDVMREEDVVETLSMMLCIRGDKRNDNRQTLYDDEGMMVGSVSSMWGMFGLGGGIMEGCHFDLRDEDDKDDKEGRSVVIRNIPSDYIVEQYGRGELRDMITSHSPRKIRQVRMKIYLGRGRIIVLITLPTLKIVMRTKEGAITLEEKMNETNFKGRNLIVKRIMEI